ncbi:hypothetical protein ccbrp13_23490 [Ktedonobacteria bacterium brp13]|nr:hypothetical protein ccbrp13_23490 [Ktedonobacteria bacterium brp13]
MIFERPSRTMLSAHQEGQSSFPIPMVYEHVPAQRLPWEYHVLTIDSAEQALPDEAQLNALGSEGWILVAVVDTRTREHSSLVHYYFTRQAQQEEKKK